MLRHKNISKDFAYILVTCCDSETLTRVTDCLISADAQAALTDRQVVTANWVFDELCRECPEVLPHNRQEAGR